MPWLQLILTADKAQAPTIEALFEGLGALAVTYGDAGEQPLLEPAPGEARLWSRSRITALFDAQRDPDLLRAALRNALPETTAQSLELQTLADKGSLFITRPTMLTYNATTDELRQSSSDLFARVLHGDVRIEINQRYALANVQQAHRDLEGRNTTGSTVLQPGADNAGVYACQYGLNRW